MSITRHVDEPNSTAPLPLDYVTTHVFLPVELPADSDYTLEMDRSLARAVCDAADAHSAAHLDGTSAIPWNRVKKMLFNLKETLLSELPDRGRVNSQLAEMKTGDIISFPIRSYNSATVLTKMETYSLFESFEMSPHEGAVLEAPGPLICPYPGFAVEIPNEVFDNSDFRSGLADFVCRPDAGSHPSLPLTHAQFIAELLGGIFEGVCYTSNVPRIVKRIHDNVVQRKYLNTWRRSSLWLLIRVAIQSTLNRSLGRASYKIFVLFFMCTLANDENIATLPTDRLHLMACKILRRLSKLEPYAPRWLSQTALRTCASLRKILDARWLQLGSRSSPFRNPSKDELERDTELSLKHSREYIHGVLANVVQEPLPTTFLPRHHRRGTINDFLSSNGAFFKNSYLDDPDVTLYDVEKAVEEGIDDWITSVVNVDKACAQLEVLMDDYMKTAHDKNPEDISTKLLTGIELFIAIDRLAVQEVPMLANYSPEVPTACLERLLLRKTSSLHRLSRSYQYLYARQSRSFLRWSVLSDEFLKDSLPVSYYDQSPHLQRQKIIIEKDAEVFRSHFRSPLPTSPLHAKVIVFELQCPPSIHVWRSAAARVWHHFHPNHEEINLLSHTPTKVQNSKVVDRRGSLSVHIEFIWEGSQENPVFRYEIRRPHPREVGRKVRIPWQFKEYSGDWWRSLDLWRYFPQYVKDTSHTPNDVLAAQVNCPNDLSLDEFLTFGQLRSGGSLQWLNILLGLRSRTLNLRHRDVHLLLACAISQAGPLDLNTGTWIWHEELHDAFFCNSLLDELENLFVDVGAQVVDAVMMKNISLLLTRVLSSSSSESVSGRALALLRTVRRKTFGWLQELSYDLAQVPANEKRRDLLLQMVAACRSTFDVDLATFPKLFLSAEDISAILLCALIVQGLDLFFEQGYRLFIDLERILSDVVLEDVSDYGMDYAICKFYPSHKPGTSRWEKLTSPNTRWFTCQTKGTASKPSQIVHLNLVNGELRVDGQPVGKLLRAIRDKWPCKQISIDQDLFVLSTINSITTTMIQKDKVHFFLRDDHLTARTKCYRSKATLEWIPSRLLKNDLPPALVDDCIHWLNLSTGTMEIRPLERPLDESSEDWRIERSSDSFRAYNARETLVNTHSPTGCMLSRCFACFDANFSHHEGQSSGTNLFITTSLVPSTSPILLSVNLPHHGLSFSVNEEGELESHEFKNMVYDENQCLGALYGLEDILVLRQKTNLAEGLISRRVLVPNGFPEKKDKYRARIDARFGDGKQLYHTYEVDAELGCLIGNSDLASTRQLAYMHAATNWDRPDPLTNKTGLQAALYLLESGRCRSIMKLKSLDGDEKWTSTQYPQINLAYKGIRNRYYWEDTKENIRVDMHEKRQAQRAAYLFSCCATGSASLAGSVPHTPLPSDISGQSTTEKQTPWEQVTLNGLFFERTAPELPPRSILRCHSQKVSSDDAILELSQLFSSFESVNKSRSPFQKKYIARLSMSAQWVHKDKDPRMTRTLIGNDRIDILEKHYGECRANYLSALDVLRRELGPTTVLQQALCHFGQWPAITGDALLRCLASTAPIILPEQWKKCLLSFALLLLDLQRARRLLQFSIDNLEEEFVKEVENEVCDGWSPENYPDWLLIQIQGRFLIRRIQAEAAMEIISPKSGMNTVMQVNMGEGKSSVIIPITAAALADGKQLARVVVPKPLTTQMFDLLVAHLGGLVNRPIYHLPFSRSPGCDYLCKPAGIDDLQKLMPQCMAERGILLAQPDHVASLKLMCVQEQIRKGKRETNSLPKVQKSFYTSFVTPLLLKSVPKGSFLGNIFGWPTTSHARENTFNWGYDEQSSGVPDGASQWLNLLEWTHANIRDILDESDEILHPRFQLIYTIGTEQHMDGYPDRWTITQEVLQIVKECVQTLSSLYPNSFEIECGPPGSFPHVAVAQISDISERLRPLVVERVMAGQISNINFRIIPLKLRDAIRSFISDGKVQTTDSVKKAMDYAKSSDQTCLWNGLLLLRGLLASNIPLFTLTERRWRVNYGLVLQSRDIESCYLSRLAVPYRAKDMPAPNTQFGHPDITIILTCLSYYYSGLSEQQLRTSFEILLDEDDPYTEYARWIDCEAVPESLRTLNEINLKSSEQWDNVTFPLFFRNQATINFYLSRVVFPIEAKEFPWKLCTSSWDLAEKRENIITGFLGTNDGQWLLPMSIDHYDLDHQRGTNARVLAYLLRPENDFYMKTHGSGERLTTPELLQAVTAQHPDIRALLDVGAQILDYSNRQVAEAWLDITLDAAGAVYFDENDELTVLMRNGISLPMLSSPLSQQLHRCVVYLDQAHTRGTDIKFPDGSRAAVTLGLKLTKDHLVQGCMRMRKLGRGGHSVMFFAPPEVDLSIRSLTGKKDLNAKITTVDILCWAINETWNDIQQWAPYWAKQGMDHKSRQDALSRFCNNATTLEQLSDVWLHPASRSLEDLYEPCTPKHYPMLLDPAIQQHCEHLGVLSLPGVEMDEEQEREVHQERECEREMELPPRAKPAKHFLHPDVVNFVKTGIIPASYFSNSFRPIFTTLEKSSAAAREADVWSPFILATADFCNTIKPESTKGTIDQYLRPVQWVLSSERDSGQVLVLVSPFEADRLLPDIRASDHVHLHLYAPRKSQRMRPSDDLKFYVIPPLPSGWTPPWALIDQLNIFAGQLYLDDYNSYVRLCHFLGIPTDESQNVTSVRRNLMNLFANLEENESKFTRSPLASVMALLAIRNRGRPFSHTHMGKILYGEILKKSDFDTSRSDRPAGCDDV